jgi:uncharacterized membrane protein YphA (DoxX/SURF4 family)
MNIVINNSFLTLASRLFVGTYFILAAVTKIADPTDFAGQIENYTIMPNIGINIMALILPWLEVITAIMLIIGTQVKSASRLMIAMIVMFNIAILYAFFNGINIDCGCGLAEEKVGYGKVIKNLGLVVLLLQVYFSKSTKFMLGK